MIIFQVGQEAELRDIANALGSATMHRTLNPTNHILHHFDKNVMSHLPLAEMKKIIMVAHANRETVGKYTPEKLAAAFKKRFESTYGANADKSSVEDIYIAGCDVGLAEANKKSLAQRIADEFEAVGFKKIKIHAIANPENVPPESSLVVSVIHGTGTERDGLINAHLYTASETEEIKQLELQLAAADTEYQRRAIKNKIGTIKNNAFKFVSGANPITEFDKPNNTFKPGESVKARQTRLENEPYNIQQRQLLVKHVQAIPAKARAIALINKRREYLQTKYDLENRGFSLFKNPVEIARLKSLLDKVSLLLTCLNNSTDVNWQKIIQDNLPNFKTVANKIKKGGTYKLLFVLANDESAIITHHLNKGEINAAYKKVLAAKDKSRAQATPQLTNREAASSSSDRDSLLAEDKSQEEPATVAPMPSGKSAFEKHLAEIQTTIAQLSTEKGALEKSFFRNYTPYCLFNRYEIETKKQKIAALTDLAGAKNIEELCTKTRGYQANERVMRSVWSSKVSTLLNSILPNDTGTPKNRR